MMRTIFLAIAIVVAGVDPTTGHPQADGHVGAALSGRPSLTNQDALPARRGGHGGSPLQVDHNQQESHQKESYQQELAPGFTLKNMTGRSTRLSDYKGKVVLVNFWATWCAPCEAEMPALVDLQNEYRDRGLRIIGVTFPPEHRNAVRRVMRRFKLNYPVLFGTRQMTNAYAIGEVLPVTIVIGRDGKIRERILGMLEPEDFKDKVAPLLETIAPNGVTQVTRQAAKAWGK